jgi:hypothetical protein
MLWHFSSTAAGGVDLMDRFMRLAGIQHMTPAQEEVRCGAAHKEWEEQCSKPAVLNRVNIVDTSQLYVA